ncbi:MAG TPA: formate dehydrogenase [Ideonella sp.]|uniref:formate dehydrogenase n=1 Tax=Ideonella sp. TaxID=1929293 RepID=UPI002E330AE3|nr:formate dehydrogenase [Ideonella sp.]HEX5688052.1 formate dehydrogenase [Ideonella sp.]
MADLTPSNPPAVSRRRLFAGAGTAGALAATAVALPLVPVAPATTNTDPVPKPQGGGYRLSAHVQRYYQTAKV